MSWIIDALAFLGVFVLSAGVFLEFGPGFALIVLGSCVMFLALVAAKGNEHGPAE